MKILPCWTTILLISVAQPLAAAAASTETENQVGVRAIKRDFYRAPIHVTGQLARKTSLRLSFSTGGLIDRVLVNEGDKVKKGQLLATLDDREINARMQKAQSNYEFARSEWQRDTNLYKQGLLSLSRYQGSKADLDAAASQLEDTKFAHRLATITAPIEGEVIKRQVEPQELVRANETAFVISAGTYGWLVNAELIDTDVVNLALGDQATVSLSAYPGQTFRGVISEISAQANPQTGRFPVEIKLDNMLPTFRAGYLASIDIRPKSPHPYSFIPVESLISTDKDQAVFFAFNESLNKVEKVSVGVSFIDGDEIATEAPLERLTHVVTTGAEYLKPGDSVTYSQL